MLVGNIWGSSGYANHTRNLAKAIDKIIPVKLETQIYPGYEMQIDDQELEMIKRNGEYNIVLMITLPIYWNKFIEKDKKNLGFLVWEGDKIPLCWLKECLNPFIHRILVPSKHTKDAIIRTAEENGINIENKIWIIHHGVDIDRFKPKENKDKIFRFLCNKGYRNKEDRGGIQYAIQAFIEEFKEENVEMIIKLNPAYPPGNLPIHPKIKIITEDYNLDELIKLYQNCDVFVSTTRAEAFNIPCIEAMACGKPVITTNFGGQTDFCNTNNGWIVDGELKLVEHEVMYEETKWLTPDIKLIRESMREAYEHPQFCREKGILARTTAEQFTWEKSAKKLINLINETFK
jgi:glycosyltransferase involved in cell wall biosynthesis